MRCFSLCLEACSHGGSIAKLKGERCLLILEYSLQMNDMKKLRSSYSECKTLKLINKKVLHFLLISTEELIQGLCLYRWPHLNPGELGKQTLSWLPPPLCLTVTALPMLLWAWFCERSEQNSRPHDKGGWGEGGPAWPGRSGLPAQNNCLARSCSQSFAVPNVTGAKEGVLDNRNQYRVCRKGKALKRHCEKRGHQRMFWFYFIVVKQVGFGTSWDKQVLSASLLP